jgi:hypothetical protein
MEKTETKIEDLEVQLESHIFTCVKYKNTPDSGFSANLYLLIEAIEHSDKVTDENIKLIAKGILGSVMHHQIQKHDMDKVNKNLEEWREKKAKEAESAKEEIPEKEEN